VAVKNLVEPDIVPLARYARENGFEVRYIEFMPLDAQNLWDRGKVLLADEIIDTLSREIAPLRAGARSRSPRAGFGVRLCGWHRPCGIHRLGEPPFCLNCNRIRLTADGKLRYASSPSRKTTSRA
jgi:cyclic pyranopterin phosphate synthase